MKLTQDVPTSCFRWSAVLLPAVLLLAPAAVAHPETALTLALEYIPPDLDDDEVIDVTGLDTYAIRVEPPIDLRREPDRIGVNVEDEDPVNVYSSTPVAYFVEDAIRATLLELGLDFGDSEDLTLVTRIQELYVVESHVYRGSVRLKLSVYQGERELWSGLALGSDTVWGRSLNAENYVEVLSESLHDALEEAFTDPGFRDAIRMRRYRR